MQLEELKTIWQENATQTAPSRSNFDQLLTTVTQNRLRSGLFEVRFTAWFELIANTLFLYFLLNFLLEYGDEIRMLLSSLALAGLMLSGIIISSYRLVLQHRIRPGEALTPTLRRLETLRLLERQERRSLLWLIPLFSVCFVVVIARAFLQIDLFELIGNHLWFYVGGSGIVAIIIVLFLRLFPDKELEGSIQLLKEIRELEGR
jgi:uncharacterized membrane protein